MAVLIEGRSWGLVNESNGCPHLLDNQAPASPSAVGQSSKSHGSMQQSCKPRFGAVGKHGSIAVIERHILTVKQTIGQLSLIPLRRETFRQEMVLIGAWYNEHRPHMTLGGKTPNEVYGKRFPANRKPRIEPRPCWPRGSPCAKPQALVAGNPGQRFEMNVAFHANRRHLPIITPQRAA